MTRRTYSCLAIARRHQMLFAALYRSASDRADVRDGSDGHQLPNSAMAWQTEADATVVVSDTETQRMEPVPGSALQWVRFPGIAFRADPDRRHRALSAAVEQVRALVRADFS